MLLAFPDIAPGLIIQFLGGRPVNKIVPVATLQAGCITVLAIGVDGIAGCGSIIALTDGNDVHPAAFVTVKVYAPETRPEIVVLVVLPVIAPGLSVQFPVGKLFKITLPVATMQVGNVTNPGIGARGVNG